MTNPEQISLSENTRESLIDLLSSVKYNKLDKEKLEKLEDYDLINLQYFLSKEKEDKKHFFCKYFEYACKKDDVELQTVLKDEYVTIFNRMHNSFPDFNSTRYGGYLHMFRFTEPETIEVLNMFHSFYEKRITDEELKELYSFIMEDNPGGFLSKIISNDDISYNPCNYNGDPLIYMVCTNQRTYINNKIKSIFKRIKECMGPYLKISFITKSSFSIYSIENRFLRICRNYMDAIRNNSDNEYFEMLRKELKNKDKIEDVEDENKVVYIFNDFLKDKDCGFIKYFYERNYPDRNMNADICIIKEKYPDIYNKYKEKVDKSNRVQFAILADRSRKIKSAIYDRKFKLPMMELLRIHNPHTVEALNNFFLKNINGMEDNVKKPLFSFYNRNRSAFNPLNIKSAMDAKVIVAGKELTNEDKENIIQYIKDNDLPLVQGLYMEIYRGYLKGEFNLSIPFMENV